MRKYLSDVISAQSSRRQERIEDLLEEARVGKQQLAVLVERLKSGVSGTSSLQVSTEGEGLYITSGPTTDNLRQIALKIGEMYRLSNLISLLLNSHASVLSSEIKTMEEELSTMEKMASNYAFLLSDAKSFDYANLEPFNDYNMMNREIARRAPDRSATRFGPSDIGSIDKNAGVLGLPRTRTVAYNIYPRIISTNHGVKSQNLQNTTSRSSAEGWKSEYVSSSPITSSIPGTSAEPGAQVVLEYELPEPQAASHVKVSPFSNIPLHLESVKIFLEDASEPISLLSESILMDREVEFSFPMNTVSKFQLHINQRTFTRSFEPGSKETHTRSLLQELKKGRDRNIRNIEDRLLRNRPSSRIGAFTPRDFIKDLSNMNDVTKPPMSEALRRILWDGIEAYQQNSSAEIINDSRSLLSGTVSPVLMNDPEKEMTIRIPRPIPQIERDGYRYILGIKSVSLGLSDPNYRGVFVSKSFDAEGDIGEIRLKAKDNHYVSPDASLNNRILTSVEYSVSNKPDPTDEDDWKPILPIGQPTVVSERLFPNEFGLARFRFLADRQEVLKVYRNGVLFSKHTLAYDADKGVSGIKIPVNRMSSDDVFTVDYTPSSDATTVKLDDVTNFEDIPLTAAFDNTGAGEYFDSTGEKNTVTLTHLPYIDRDRASETGFNPVVVVPDDGTPAVNVTDYTKSNTATFPTDDESYYYIHSGRKLLFNKPIDGLRVFYQYLENNVSFRVVLRCNAKDFVSPKVDYVHVKAKLRKPDQSL